jgi:hypothetical protein
MRLDLCLRLRDRILRLRALRASTAELRIQLRTILSRENLTRRCTITLAHIQLYDATRIFHSHIDTREFQPPIRLYDIGGQGFGVTGVPPVDSGSDTRNRH